jgi:hypothetical protein
MDILPWPVARAYSHGQWRYYQSGFSSQRLLHRRRVARIKRVAIFWDCLEGISRFRNFADGEYTDAVNSTAEACNSDPKERD